MRHATQYRSSIPQTLSLLAHRESREEPPEAAEDERLDEPNHVEQLPAFDAVAVKEARSI